MFSFILDFELIKPVIILFSQLQLQMNFSSQLLPNISEQHSQVVSLSVMSGVCVLELWTESLDVGLVKLGDFDFHQLDFSLVMKYQLLYLSFELIIVRYDIAQSFLLVFFQEPVDFEESSDFLLLSLDDFFQSVDFICVELFKVSLALWVVFPFLLKLGLIESCDLFDSLVVSDIIFLQFISHLAFISGQSVEVVFVFFSCLFKFACKVVDLVLSFLKFVT